MNSGSEVSNLPAEVGIKSDLNGGSPRGSTNTSTSGDGQSYSAPKYGTLVPNRVFVGGIASSTTEEELHEVFSMYGQVRAIKIIQDRAGVSKGYGFVTFETEEEARRLFIAIHSREIGPIIVAERRLNIAPAVKKQSVQNPFDGQGNGPTWPDFSYVQPANTFESVGASAYPSQTPPTLSYYYANGNGQYQHLTPTQVSCPYYTIQNSGSSFVTGPAVQQQPHHMLQSTYFVPQGQTGSAQQLCIVPQPAPLNSQHYFQPQAPSQGAGGSWQSSNLRWTNNGLQLLPSSLGGVEPLYVFNPPSVIPPAH